MQFLKSLFKKEDFVSESDRVLSDKELIESQLVVPDESDPEQMISAFKKRIGFLSDGSLHPVARLKAAVTDYDDMITDYVSKLRQTAEDYASINEVKDIKSKVGNVLHDELKMLRAQLSFAEQALERKHAFAGSAGAKWAELEKVALEDINIARARIEIIVPKDKKDFSQWKSYYRARVGVLENKSINVAARLLFTSHKDKQALVGQYLQLLNRLLLQEDVEKFFHNLEGQMETIVSSEARRIRLEYPQFFAPERVEEREIFRPKEITKSLLDF